MSEAMTTEMKQLLDVAIEKGASDLHVTVGVPPMITTIRQLAERSFLRREFNYLSGGMN